MSKGILEWEEFIWLTVPERVVFVLAEKRGSKPQAGEAAGGENWELTSSNANTKQKERTRSSVRRWTPKPTPSNILPPARLHHLNCPQTAPTNWEPSFKYKSLRRTSLLKLPQCLSFKFLFVASLYKPSLVFPKFILRFFDEIPKHLFSWTCFWPCCTRQPGYARSLPKADCEALTAEIETSAVNGNVHLCYVSSSQNKARKCRATHCYARNTFRPDLLRKACPSKRKWNQRFWEEAERHGLPVSEAEAEGLFAEGLCSLTGK